MAVALEIQGIISLVMAAMFVVAGAYLLSTIFIPSGEEYSIMAMRDIASHAKKIDKADSGDCSDFRIKVPSGFRINVEEKEIILGKIYLHLLQKKRKIFFFLLFLLCLFLLFFFFFRK